MTKSPRVGYDLEFPTPKATSNFDVPKQHAFPSPPTRSEEARDADTYPMPPDGWVCFHCGERFTTPGAAQDHFGETPEGVSGCIIKAGDERGLLMALRKAEAEVSRLNTFIEPMQRKESNDTLINRLAQAFYEDRHPDHVLEKYPYWQDAENSWVYKSDAETALAVLNGDIEYVHEPISVMVEKHATLKE